MSETPLRSFSFYFPFPPAPSPDARWPNIHTGSRVLFYRHLLSIKSTRGYLHFRNKIHQNCPPTPPTHKLAGIGLIVNLLFIAVAPQNSCNSPESRSLAVDYWGVTRFLLHLVPDSSSVRECVVSECQSDGQLVGLCPCVHGIEYVITCGKLLCLSN